MDGRDRTDGWEWNVWGWFCQPVQIQSAADATRHDDGGYGDRAAVFVTTYSLWQDMFIPAAWWEVVLGVLADRTSPEHQTPANPDIKRDHLKISSACKQDLMRRCVPEHQPAVKGPHKTHEHIWSDRQISLYVTCVEPGVCPIKHKCRLCLEDAALPSAGSACSSHNKVRHSVDGSGGCRPGSFIRSIRTTTGASISEPHVNIHVGSGRLGVLLRMSNMNKSADSLLTTSWFTHPSDRTETNEQEINLTFIRQRCCNDVIISSFCFLWEARRV